MSVFIDHVFSFEGDKLRARVWFAFTDDGEPQRIGTHVIGDPKNVLEPFFCGGDWPAALDWYGHDDMLREGLCPGQAFCVDITGEYSGMGEDGPELEVPELRVVERECLPTPVHAFRWQRALADDYGLSVAELRAEMAVRQ